MKHRVVVTGVGAAAPNGVGIPDFKDAIKNGTSGIRYLKELEELNFSCRIGGIPPLRSDIINDYFTPVQRLHFNSSGILYGCIAGIDAWKDAGLEANPAEAPDWDSGIIFGNGISGVEKQREAIYRIDDKQVRRLGSTTVQQTMTSGVSAYIAGILGLGNQVTTNSSACATGTEAILTAYQRIKYGYARRMIAGSASDSGPYIWGGFDAMKVLTYKFNETPEKGSRPMSASASGFVPGSGAGALVLESLESALERGASIYAEILGGAANSGGQRNGGTMTAGNPQAVVRCITGALDDAGVTPEEVDLIDGHLTATSRDHIEIQCWSEALNRKGSSFPYINSLKSMTGHCIAASGAIESAAAVLELHNKFIYPSINCEDMNPAVLEYIDYDRVPRECISYPGLNIIAKASFGFGDVNTCIILKGY